MTCHKKEAKQAKEAAKKEQQTPAAKTGKTN